MPPSDGPDGDDPEAAADRYAAAPAAAARPEDHGPVPRFDVDVGADRTGTWLRCFLLSTALTTSARSSPFYAVPKPPPNWLSLTFPTI